MTSTQPFTYGSVCSGIEAATVAWHPMGWKPAWFAEIDKFPSAILAHHYPHVPNLGDFTEITEDAASIDLLVGGTPCQDFSVAGKGAGFDGLRGSLTFSYADLVSRLRPRWFVWENVPGVFRPDMRAGFFALLKRFSQLGYVCGWRVLDAQYVRVDGLARAVPQRRRRVFVVGHLGDWRRAAAVLFEPKGLCGDSAPSREAGAGVAGAVTQRIDRGGVNSEGHDGHLVPGYCPEISPAIKARDYKGPSSDGDGDGAPIISEAYQCQGGNVGPMGTLRAGNGNETGGVPFVAHTLRSEGHDASEDGTGRGVPLVFDTTQITSDSNYSNPQPGDPSHPLAAGAHAPAVAFNWQAGGTKAMVGGNLPRAAALQANQIQAVCSASTVRRLTPLECERLMGFPDNYTHIPYGRPKHPDQLCPDGPRYKALGNSKAINVIRWLGRRIQAVEQLTVAP